MGTIYRAEDLQSGAEVALKLLRTDASSDLGRRFVREAKLLLSLGHPGIVRYVAHGSTEEGQLFIAMEFLRGQDLHDRIKEGPLSPHKATRVAVAIAEALEHAHSHGVVHRDLKPRNVFLVDRDLSKVKVLDFGIALATEGTMVQTGSEVLGTPGYMAPEQARGEGAVDARADVFSLGCVLYHAMIGRPPFAAKDLVASLSKLLFDPSPRIDHVLDGLPAGLADIVADMMAKDPSARPSSMLAARLRLTALDFVEEVSAYSSISRRAALTARERTHLAVVAARPGKGAAVDERAVAPVVAAVEVIFGARIERAADGGVIAVLSGGATASEEALTAVRCAEHFRAELAGWSCAAALGRGVVTEGSPVSEVIKRASVALASTPPGSVGLDPTCAALAESHYDLEDPAPTGASQVRILLKERGSSGAGRTLLGRRLPCVGRERELASLQGMIAECFEEGVARAVVVTGPPGIGKTRIVSELVGRETKQRGVAVWSGRGDPMGAGSPFGILSEVLRSGLGVQRAAAPEEQRRALSTAVENWLPLDAAPRVATFVQEILGLGLPLSQVRDPMLRSARQNPMQMGDLMLRAFEDLLSARVARGPLLLMFEDLHWADVPSLRFVSAALRFAKDSPLFVLGVARPEALSAFPAFFADQVVAEQRLSPLGRKAALRLAEEAARDVALPAAVMEDVVARADGNPFFLEELLRNVLGGGDVRELPETVIATVEGRLRGLSPDSRRVLRAASIFGQRFWFGGLSALLGEEMEPGRLSVLVSQLEELEVCARQYASRYPGDTEYAFRHALVRDAAYAALTDEDRRLGHALAAAYLEEMGEHDPMLLAEHHERAKSPMDAVRNFEAAAMQALEGNDFRGAVAHATRAIESGALGSARLRLLLLVAEAHQWAGESKEAFAAANQVREAGLAAGPLYFHALTQCAEAAGRLGYTDEVLSIADAIEDAEPDPAAPRPYLEALGVVLQRLVFNGMADRATELASRLSELPAAAHEDLACVAFIHRAHAAVGQIVFDVMADMDHRRASAEAFEQIGDFRQTLSQRINLANCYVQVGAYELAEQELRVALGFAERMNLPVSIANSKSNLGHVLGLLGAFADSELLLRESIAMFEQQGNLRLESATRTYLAMTLFETGRDAEAREEIERAISVAPAESDRIFALSFRARLELTVGDVERALADATAAVTSLDELGGIDEGEIQIRLVFAEALLAAGRRGEAIFAIRFAKERLRHQSQSITDPALRTACLTRVPENARLRALSHEIRGKRDQSPT